MEKNVKWKYEPYAFYNKKGIEDRLGAMAMEGWMIEGILGSFWTYRRGVPAKRVYNVVYIVDAADQDEVNRHQEFIEYCESAGWVLAVVTSGMLVFYHEGENPVPIETEPELELENIHRSMKAGKLQSYITIGLMAVVQAFEICMQWYITPLNVLASNQSLYLLIFIFMGLVLLADIGFYWTWRKKALQMVEDYRALPKVKHHPGYIMFTSVVTALVWILFGIFLLSTGEILSYLILAGILALVLWSYFKEKINADKRMQKLKGMSLQKGRRKVGFFFLMAVGLGLLVGMALLMSHHNAVENDRRKLENAPVTLEDLITFDDIVDLDTSYYDSDSILLKKETFIQYIENWNHAFNEEDDVSISYTLVNVKVDAIYDFAFTQFCEQDGIDLEEYEKGDASKWNAGEVYQSRNEYIVLWEDAFAEIQFSYDWKLTDEQIQIVAVRMRGSNN